MPKTCALFAGILLTLVAASAAPADRPSQPETLGSEHFLVHFALTGRDAIAPSEAVDFATAAEAAWARIVGRWGFPTPLSDGGLGGDDRIDVYVTSGVRIGREGGAAPADSTAPQTSGSIVAPPHLIDMRTTVAYELFRLVELGLNARETTFMRETSGAWAAREGAWAAEDTFYSWETRPLECGDRECDPARRKGFFIYLASRYGPSVIRDMWLASAQRGPGTPHELDAVADALALRDVTMATAWNDFIAMQVGVPAAVDIGEPFGGLVSPAKVMRVDSWTLPHLATAFVVLRGRRLESGDLGCTRAERTGRAATLHVRVDFSAPTASVPALALYEMGPSGRPGTVALGVTERRAILALPRWRACSLAVLAVPSPSATDGITFSVDAWATGSYPTTPLVHPKKPAVQPKTKDGPR